MAVRWQVGRGTGWANSRAGHRGLTGQKEQRKILRTGILNIQWCCLQVSDANFSLTLLTFGKVSAQSVFMENQGQSVGVTWRYKATGYKIEMGTEKQQIQVREHQGPCECPEKCIIPGETTGLGEVMGWACGSHQQCSLTKGPQSDVIFWIVQALLVDTAWFLTLYYGSLQIFGKVEIIVQMNTYIYPPA